MASIDLTAKDRAKIEELCALQLERVQAIRERSNVSSCQHDLTACVASYQQLLSILAQRNASLETIEDPVSSSTPGSSSGTSGQRQRMDTVVSTSGGDSADQTPDGNAVMINNTDKAPSFAKSRKFMYRVLPMLVGALLAFLVHKFIEIRIPRKRSR